MSATASSKANNLTLFTIFGLSFFSSFGNPLVIPLYPQIMEHYQITPLEISLMLSVYALPGVFIIPVLGFLQDRLGRKPILLTSLILCFLSSLGMAFTDSFALFLLGRVGQGLAVPQLDALSHTLISDHYDGPERLKNIGHNTSALFIGVATFPLLSSATAWLFGWRTALLLPCALALPLFLLCLRLPMPYRQAEFKLNQYGANLRKLLASPRLLSLFGARVWSALIMFGAIHTYLPFLIMDKLGGNKGLPGIYFALFSICLALGSISLGRLTKRFATLHVAIGATLLQACALFFFLLVPDTTSLIPPLLAYGAASGMLTALIIACIAQSATSDTKATVLSLSSTAFRAAQAVSPPLCGILFSIGGFSLFYGVATLAAFGMLGVVYSAFRTRPEPGQ